MSETDQLLEGLTLGRGAPDLANPRHKHMADRILHTRQEVNKHHQLRDRLRAAMQLLDEDVTQMVAENDVETATELLETFRANMDAWIDMVFGEHGTRRTDTPPGQAR